MKRTMTVLLCMGLVILAAACGADAGSSSDSLPPDNDPSLSQGSQSIPLSSSGQESSLPEEPPASDDYLPFADFMTPGDFENFCLREGMRPNVTALSPNGEKLLFFRQEFEEPTDLWAVGKDSQPQLILSSEKQLSQNAIKSALWYNEDTVLLIIGYRYGTVSPGGDVYRLDMTSTTLHLLYRPESDREQVVSMKVEDECLVAEVAVYDEDYNNHTTEVRTVPLLVENAAVGRYTQEPLPADAAGLAVDSPDVSGTATVDVMDLDDSGEGILIVPRYAGSDIRVYSVKQVGDGFVNSGWLGAVYNTSDDYVLRLNTVLPEGAPTVKVVINCFGRHGEFLVSYDGRGETSVRIIK